jgi:hypothetical protein
MYWMVAEGEECNFMSRFYKTASEGAFSQKNAMKLNDKWLLFNQVKFCSVDSPSTKEGKKNSTINH